MIEDSVSVGEPSETAAVAQLCPLGLWELWQSSAAGHFHPEQRCWRTSHLQKLQQELRELLWQEWLAKSAEINRKNIFVFSIIMLQHNPEFPSHPKDKSIWNTLKIFKRRFVPGKELTVLFEVWLLLFSLDPAVGISLTCPSGM